jgi:UDP-3-O-[3-hydroxymyristoyl] glucosamine N-acyltransferase
MFKSGFKPVTIADLLAAFPDLLTLVRGPDTVQILSPAPHTDPAPHSLVFVSDSTIIGSVFSSPAAAIVVPSKVLTSKPVSDLPPTDATILHSANPYVAMARINQRFFPPPPLRKNWDHERIHSTALIHPTATVHPTAVVAPYVVICSEVHVGANSFIGAHATLEPHVKVGENCFIHPQVFLGHSVTLGDRVEIKPNSTIGSDGFGFAKDAQGSYWKIPHYGQVIIHDDVYIGANVNIDRGTYKPTVIGKGTKIDNHCHIAHNLEVGQNNVITAGFIAAGSAKIGSNCTFAGRVSVNGHIEVGDGISLGPLTAVTNDLKTPGAYMGFPPIPFRDALKMQASLGHLPSLRRSLAKVLRHLNLTDDGE